MRCERFFLLSNWNCKFIIGFVFLKQVFIIFAYSLTNFVVCESYPNVLQRIVIFFIILETVDVTSSSIDNPIIFIFSILAICSYHYWSSFFTNEPSFKLTCFGVRLMFW